MKLTQAFAIGVALKAGDQLRDAVEAFLMPHTPVTSDELRRALADYHDARQLLDKALAER